MCTAAFFNAMYRHSSSLVGLCIIIYTYIYIYTHIYNTYLQYKPTAGFHNAELNGRYHKNEAVISDYPTWFTADGSYFMFYFDLNEHMSRTTIAMDWALYYKNYFAFLHRPNIR